MSQIDAHVISATTQGNIVYQHCGSCGHDQAFARRFCVKCLGSELEWRHAEGSGTAVACTTLHRAPTPDWKTRLPYTIALVDLAEGPRVMALADSALRPGDRAVLRPGGVHDLPFFNRVETS